MSVVGPSYATFCCSEQSSCMSPAASEPIRRLFLRCLHTRGSLTKSELGGFTTNIEHTNTASSMSPHDLVSAKRQGSVLSRIIFSG